MIARMTLLFALAWLAFGGGVMAQAAPVSGSATCVAVPTCCPENNGASQQHCTACCTIVAALDVPPLALQIEPIPARAAPVAILAQIDIRPVAPPPRTLASITI